MIWPASIDRDLDAVALHLDPWILAAEPDHDARSTSIPLLGTPEWVAADEATRNAAVALYVIACLVRWGPVVTERREGSNQQLARNACRRRPTPERDQRRGGGGLDR